MPATAKCDSHYCTCLDCLVWRNRHKIISIFYCAAQGDQGKYNSDCHVLLLPAFLP
jgi:hypothetical protein